ncbi:nitrous oxide reductase family maturation protein NosD [Kiloniella antarctica]|uniref:Nitrous oxide reductase family maturation protein NosD n=1 Tax=Kiloniella antarctica TaxID=1550907 RepID=A0ABW5BNM1_9PROT
MSPESQSLTEVLESTQTGDTIILTAGIYSGSLIIDKSITIQGESGAVIDGQGQGHTIKINAPNTVISGLHIRNSGQDLSEQDSGIFIHKTAHNTVVENNFLQNNLIGIYLWGPKKAVVRGNRIEGLQVLHVNDRGNGIQLWNTPGSIIEGNTVQYGRDGIFTTTSKKNVFLNNTFKNTRFAIHYMYTNNSEVSGNVSIDNDVGFALMFSKKLKVTNNHSINDNEHGFALNYANSSVFEGNSVKNGGVKCVFIYNSNKNIFKKNHFEGCGIGIHFTAGSEQNTITENAFIGNRHQVKYVGTRDLDWSKNNRGNYWSDNPAFDLNGDGISDSVYRPNDVLDRVIWASPSAKLLINSPAMEILRWSQSQFPSLQPGGVYDSAPLMTPAMSSVAENQSSSANEQNPEEQNHDKHD